MVKNPPAKAEDTRDVDSIPRSGRSPGRKWQPTPVFLPGQRSLVGYSAWATELGMVEHKITSNQNTHHIKLTILTIFEHAVQWQ